MFFSPEIVIWVYIYIYIMSKEIVLDAVLKIVVSVQVSPPIFGFGFVYSSLIIKFGFNPSDTTQLK